MAKPKLEQRGAGTWMRQWPWTHICAHTPKATQYVSLHTKKSALKTAWKLESRHVLVRFTDSDVTFMVKF